MKRFYDKTFQFLGKTWDLKKARRLVIEHPRPAEEIPVSATHGMMNLVWIDKERAVRLDPLDLDPIITAWESDWGGLLIPPGRLVIDGWNRLYGAYVREIPKLLAHHLTETESKEILV